METYEDRPIYGERRPRTVAELESLRPGTIFVVHGSMMLHNGPVDDNSVWMVLSIPGKAELVSHGGSEMEDLSWFAVDSEDRRISTPPEVTLRAVDTTYLAKASGQDKLKIFLNKNLKWSKGKRAAHAVHTALVALGVHTGQGVVVLDATPTQINKMPTLIHDAGQTELEPGTLTGGTYFPSKEPEK